MELDFLGPLDNNDSSRRQWRRHSVFRIGWMASLLSDGGYGAIVSNSRRGDVLLVPGDLDSGLTLSQYVIVNRENKSMDVRVEWTGDAPDSDVWEVSIPDLVEANSDAIIDISPHGELPL